MTTLPAAIGIIGHVGNGNLGDEAIISALIENLGVRLPGCEFVAFTARPDDTATRHRVTAFPLRRTAVRAAAPPSGPGHAISSASGRLRALLRTVPPLFRGLKLCVSAAGGVRDAFLESRFLAQSFRRLSSLSLLVVAGSQQLSDAVGGSWGFPYTVFKWTILARLRGIPVAIVSVGAGPLGTRLSRWFVRRTIRMATYRSYRDEVSRETVRELNIQQPGAIVGDLAFSLPSDGSSKTPPDSRTVAINPMPFVWQDYDEQTERTLYCRYLGTLASFTIWLIDRGYRVTLLATQLRMDPQAIHDLEGRVRELRAEASDPVSTAQVETLQDLLAALKSARFVVATRFHGAVLGCYATRPTLALAYHPKTNDLMAQMDQVRYTLPAQDLRLDSLQAAFIDLEGREDSVIQSLDAPLRQVRQRLARQYDQLAGLVKSSSSTHARVDEAQNGRTHSKMAESFNETSIGNQKYRIHLAGPGLATDY